MSAPATRSHNRWKWAAIAAVVLFFYLLVRMSDDLLPLFVASGLAYAFHPVVDRLERRGLSRTLATLGIMTIVAGLVVLAVATLVPLVIKQMQDFIRGFPDFVHKALNQVSTFARGYGIEVPATVDDVIDRLHGSIQESAAGAIHPAVNVARHFLSSVVGILVAFLDVLVIPILFFFVCRDLDKGRRYVLALIPPRRQPYARTLFHRVDGVLSGYIRGQMVVAAVLAVVFSIALLLLRVPFGLFIGIAAGFLNIVPFVGHATALVLSLLMALVEFHGVGQLVAIVAVFGATNFIEGHFLSPKIVGDRVGLSPLWTILALIVGGKAAGLLGMMLAVPVAGVLKILFGEILLKYKTSDFYLDPPSSTADAPVAKREPADYRD